MSADQPPAPPKPQNNRRSQLRGLAAFGALVVVACLVLGFIARCHALSPDDPPEKTYQKIVDAYGSREEFARWRCGELKYESFVDFEVTAGRPGSAPSEALVIETFRVPGRVRQDVWTLNEPRSKLYSAGS
ncbi:MAG: hypothetical protein L0241_25435, partial [Planctomycetia bacterium]|nr:hypothetical protein [Planctomycetia bacterium]